MKKKFIWQNMGKRLKQKISKKFTKNMGEK